MGPAVQLFSCLNSCHWSLSISKELVYQQGEVSTLQAGFILLISCLTADSLSWLLPAMAHLSFPYDHSQTGLCSWEATERSLRAGVDLPYRSVRGARI